MPSSMVSLSLLSHAPADALSRILQRETPLPTDADVVIVGGGIMGCSAAWHLARSNMRVVLVERSRVASQQSGRNWGFVRKLCRDPLEVPLALDALRRWPTLSAELGFETGWRRSGCLFLSQTPEEHQTYAAWHDAVRDLVDDIRLLDRGSVSDRLPALSRQLHGAIVAEDDGQAEPTLATTAFASAAEREGAVLLEDCGALRIETGGGRVTGVETEYGAIKAPAVICTAGAESYRLLGALGMAIPQKTVRSTVALTRPIPDLGLPCFVGGGLGLRQRPDGSCILATDAGTDIDITLDSLRASRFFLSEILRNRKGFAFNLGAPFIEDLGNRLTIPGAERAARPRCPEVRSNPRRTETALELFCSLFAGSVRPEIEKSWAGTIDVMPDALPVLDAPARIPGLAIATGFSGHGFGLGPAIGSLLADLIRGDAPSIDLKAFTSDRFARGAYSRPYATI